MKKVIIIGGGPAGLFCAYKLLKENIQVDLYDHSSGVGKKFLIAGNGGLNITHSEEVELFSSRYRNHENLFKKLLHEFSPMDLRSWCHDLGVETFVGSSGRVFPKKLKAGEILVKWLNFLKSFSEFNLFLNHKLIDISKSKMLTFNNEGVKKSIQGENIILSLGGGSWKKTGSDGLWVKKIEELGIKVNPLRPMNCGFEVLWSDYFIKNIERSSLKNISLKFNGEVIKGEVMLVPYGIEGGAIYSLSGKLRDEIKKNQKAKISIDLLPSLSFENILSQLISRDKKVSLSNYLRKKMKMTREEFILLKECLKKEDFENNQVLAKKIKEVPLELKKTRPIDEAISTSGGVCFSELTDFFESKKISNLYFSGEMIDFEAPTGGYLLQACFSISNRLSQGLISSIKK